MLEIFFFELYKIEFSEILFGNYYLEKLQKKNYYLEYLKKVNNTNLLKFKF